jgi:hypothetical protein
MAEQVKDTTNWPDMFVGLYDRLTGRHAEISYQFDNLEIDIPASTAANAPKANWKFNGTLRISAKDLSK